MERPPDRHRPEEAQAHRSRGVLRRAQPRLSVPYERATRTNAGRRRPRGRPLPSGAAGRARTSSRRPASSARRLAAHRLRELVDDREPEPRSDPPAVARAVVEVEALERARQVGLGDPGPSSTTSSRPGPARIRTVPPAGSSAGVLDEVRERLEHAIRIADRDRRRAPPGPGARRRTSARRLRDARTAAHRELGEIERLGADRERAAAQPREVEQVADEPLEAPRLPLDHEPRRRGLEHAVLERLRVAADRGQRRLQLVADREQEGALGVLCLVELAREVVERARERRDLPGPGDGQRLGPLARGKRRLASETRATGRETARERRNATTAARAAPTRPASPRPRANGVQSAAWLAAGRSRTIASSPLRRAA